MTRLYNTNFILFLRFSYSNIYLKVGKKQQVNLLVNKKTVILILRFLKVTEVRGKKSDKKIK